jgi:hypothetical protein
MTSKEVDGNTPPVGWSVSTGTHNCVSFMALYWGVGQQGWRLRCKSCLNTYDVDSNLIAYPPTQAHFTPQFDAEKTKLEAEIAQLKIDNKVLEAASATWALALETLYKAQNGKD